MKKSMIALATLMAIAQGAHADPISASFGNTTITLYGTLDLGYWYQSQSTSNTSGAQVPGAISAGNLSAFHSGGISPSKLGVMGERDFGNGLKGLFKLEEHIRSNTGDTEAFGISGYVRETYVGVQGNFGKVLAGRQFTPAILAYAATDPRGLRESLSGMNSWLASGTTGNTFLSAFASNSISYNVDLGPVHMGGLYAAGGKTGNASADSTYSLGASYSGPVTVSGSYEVENHALTGNKEIVKASLGIAVPIGPIVLKANYMSSQVYNGSDTKTADYKLPGVGIDWKFNDNQSVNVSYYNGRNSSVSDNRASTWVVSTEYNLDPSTTLYAQAALIDAGSKADAVVSLLGNGSIVQGANTNVINAGIRFNF